MSALGITIDERCVWFLDEGTSKSDALDQLTQAVFQAGAVRDAEPLRRAVHARDELASTGIGGGVAIPHVYLDSVEQATVAVGISRTGVEFAAMDAKPVHVMVLFVMPAGSNRLYLNLLAQLMVAMRTPNFLKQLIACHSPAEVVGILNESGG